MKTRTMEVTNKVGKFIDSKKSIKNFNCDGIDCNDCPFKLHYVGCSELKRKDLIVLYNDYLKLPLRGEENER